MIRNIRLIALLGLLLGTSLAVRAGDETSVLDEAARREELDTVTVIGRVSITAEMVARRVSEASRLLADVPLHYTYVKRLFRETLRGRPVVFAAWSERSQTWHMVEIEMPYPVPRLKPGAPPNFRVMTPGYQAVHVRGIGTERLMFDIYQGEERLWVYGRKYPIIDTNTVKKQGIRAAVATAEVTNYLPLNDDAAPLFVAQGKSLLRTTAESALRELRENKVPSLAYPGKLLGEAVLPETLMSLAVIEQTDDTEFRTAPAMALSKTMGHYGLMKDQAFTYSISTANAAGPMQFTDKRGRGTYSMVVRKCAGADIRPDFMTGARDLLNAMKAAACLLDMDMASMPREVQSEYSLSPAPLSIFAVAAYNGGGKNASKLLLAVRRLKAELADLRIPALEAFESVKSRCPCLWADRNGQTTSLTIPSYNRENMGYVDKYLRFMSMMQTAELP